MADIDEKIPETAANVPVNVKDTVPSNPIDEEPIGALGRPEGWMYREIKIGPIRIPWYASPKTQLTMVAFVCFMCPGMFNALGGLGGGGKADAKTADDMVSAPIFSEINKMAFTSLNIASLEHRPVQYFCCLWFLRWQHRQQIGRQIHSIIRWNWLLHLCHRSPDLCSLHPHRRLQYICWCFPRCLCRFAMDCSGNHYAIVSKRRIQGKILCLVLGHFQLGWCHWCFGKF
jgi:hypothetical protein